MAGVYGHVAPLPLALPAAHMQLFQAQMLVADVYGGIVELPAQFSHKEIQVSKAYENAQRQIHAGLQVPPFHHVTD